MIVVKIEVWPGGDKARAYEMGRMEIANDATTTLFDQTKGNYDAVVTWPAPSGTPIRRTARVEDYPRQEFTVWELVRRLLGRLAETSRRKGVIW